jgi:hypothetical protein
VAKTDGIHKRLEIPISSFGLSSLFHNTPEKMPAEHTIFTPGRHLPVSNPLFAKALLALGWQIQRRRVAILHAFVECRHVRGHELFPCRQLLVQLAAQHLENLILLL